MGKIKHPNLVKLFIGILVNDCKTEALEIAYQKLGQQFGKFDLFSETWNFSFTNYYADEMGERLLRKFLSFESLIDPGILKDIKHWTNSLERELSLHYGPPSRPINLDPGYLSLSKVILATTKDYSHRLYLGDGIYGEITLHYQEKKFSPLPWTYPDYRTLEYINFFQKMRNIYKTQLV